MRPPTDLDDISGTLFLIADVKVCVWRLENVRVFLLMVGRVKEKHGE